MWTDQRRPCFAAPAALAFLLPQGDPGVTGTVKQKPLLGRSELLKRSVQREAAVSRQRFGKVRKRIVGGQPRPGRERTLTKRPSWIADQQRGAGSFLHAQSFAGRTPAQRAIEGKV